MNWEKLTTKEQLDQIDQLSVTAPVVIFKHSTRCSISSAALDRIERKWNQANHEAVKPYYLDLINYREVSNAIAEKYGITHQSPQVLVVSGAKCIYDNSHFGITYDAILESIQPS
jgi:bacillithiol system protein YtxJ